LYLPLHSDSTIKGMMAPAAGNTMGGNLFILGESSVLIMQTLRKGMRH
jgi:hypothetical protein